ncbi:unnamed protein product [Triticum turgidum subsp. durum]|uniref:Peptidase C14 caspase domain-containing protein n=1 Tax=Triticum turgidum subsp. durum TaxID=4567 RepID=A0A9R0WH75_TRITD|nr:unnamed protein product [Triticum turgidum subsp. durum]
MRRSVAMNCGSGPAPATMVRCRQCSASVAAPPGARAVQCAQCCCVTRVGGAGRQLSVMRPIPNFGGGRGKKRAVLVGIKYTNTRACELRGPINDVKCMRYLLTERFGFANDCVLILTDEERDPCRQPTKANIRMAMHWLVQGCSSDDEINQAIVRPLVHGVKLHAIVDACHSATVLDLPYRCTFSKQYGCLRWMDERPLNGACKGTSGGKAVLISGSSNGKTQMSVLPEPNATIGALTHSFIKALECEPRTTYGHLLTSMRTTMRAGAGNCSLQGPVGCSIRKVANFSGVEEPQMSSACKFDINCEPFCM